MAITERIITTQEDLIRECKETGVILSIRKCTDLPATRMAYQGNYEHINEVQHYRLARAVAENRNCLIEHPCTDDLGAVMSHILVPIELLDAMNASLTSGEESDLLKVSSITLERTFVYFDVSDFSKHPPAHQALIINHLIHRARRLAAKTPMEAQLCIGDGYIFVFKAPFDAVLFAAALATEIQAANVERGTPVEIHFRVGIHTGPVYFFWDVGRNGWNYIGDGINSGQRVLAAIGSDADDVIFLSDEVVGKFRSSFACEDDKLIVKNLENKGRRKDKHGVFRRVYQLNHERLSIDLEESAR